MSEDLGFGGLLGEEGFFARLLGRSPSGRGADLLYGPDLPVVLLTGGPGMGKGRLLTAVRDRFATQVPLIHLDCASAVYGTRAQRKPEVRSAVSEALVEVAERLTTWQGTGGSFAFPRLFAGLATIAVGVSDGTAEVAGDEVERYEHLAQKQSVRGLRTDGFWRGVLRGSLKNVVMAIYADQLDPLPTAVANALVEVLFERLAPRGAAELERMYGSYPGAAGQPRIGLRILAADFRKGGADRRKAEAFLFRALREDLEAAYASKTGWLRRVGRPALLLDRAELPLGEHLLRAVLTDRRGGQRDRVVVVGTARRADGGAFLYGGLPTRRTQPPVEYRPADGAAPAWPRPTDGQPGGAPLADGALLLRMPFLREDQLTKETADRQLRAEPEGSANRLRIDAAVAGLSGGRPHTVIRLAAAVADFRMPEDGNDRDVLAAPLQLTGDGPAGRPVADVLLQELVLEQLPVELPTEYHDQWLDLLTHLSVAHDRECADVLLRHHQDGHVDPLTAYEVSRYLTDTGWPSCERHFIGDFGLRQMLLHRLYGLRPDGAAWQDDHHVLRDHYESVAGSAEAADPGPGTFRSATVHRMNHHLVSGGVDDVVGHLVATLPGRPAEWCAELLEIAQAPFPGGADARRERARGRVAVGGPALRRTVDQLLHAVWLCEERTRPTGGEMADTLQTLLRDLSREEFDGAWQLGPTATEWKELAEDDQPLLRCSCNEQLGRGR